MPVSDPLRKRESPATQAAPLAAQEVRTPQVAASAAQVRLGRVPAPLPVGQVELVAQASASLSTDAVASGRTQAGMTEIVLNSGSIQLHVLPRAPGQVFVVRAGAYRFTVVGTAFTVAQTHSRIELVVREGAVAVSRGTRRLATVGPGQQWATDIGPTVAMDMLPREADESLVAVPPNLPPQAPLAFAPSPATEPPTGDPPAGPRAALPARAATPTQAAAVVSHADCGQLAASNHAHEALTCYQDQAEQGGLAGETAQYELARLWRDSFGNLASALQAFQRMRSRFPGGVLRTEADLSIIEILPRLGRHSDALAESERFLIAHPEAGRSGEIHLLRGNIFREALHDLNRAEHEYAQGAESGGRTGDDSRFLRAVCLEALGRTEEARKAYQAYVLHSDARHTQEAKKRLDHFRP
jgi:hypothetical protein